MDLFDTVGSAGAPLVLVTGPAGAGRTTLLARLREELVQRGTRVSSLRFTPDGTAAPAVFGTRPEPAAPGLTGRAVPWSSIGPISGARDNPVLARRAAAAAAGSLLRGDGNATVLIDDAQWVGHDSLAVLEALVRRVAGSPVRCVCAVRTPVPDAVSENGSAALRRLRLDELVRSVRLPLIRPLWT
ncbi:ATP-binding protein [Amycolatopsis minnesotensis]|uniref:Orc1-like AAA ATPase domain-containing protein n=1 Tax=Amycolatopsis minnesotensis TaxID=337894 RepID=A0ABP5CJX0_9PSEU